MYEIWIFGERRIVINDVEIAKKVLNARPDHYTRGAEVAKLASKLGVPSGVFSLEGDNWRRHRRLLAPAFTKSAVNKMHHCIDEPLGTFQYNAYATITAEKCVNSLLFLVFTSMKRV